MWCVNRGGGCWRGGGSVLMKRVARLVSGCVSRVCYVTRVW